MSALWQQEFQLRPCTFIVPWHVDRIIQCGIEWVARDDCVAATAEGFEWVAKDDSIAATAKVGHCCCIVMSRNPFKPTDLCNLMAGNTPRTPLRHGFVSIPVPQSLGQYVLVLHRNVC